MELKKIYFDAYKSLLKKELELTHSCIGIVGINESGKSNVLHAISTLSNSNPLIYSNTPKMEQKPDPYVRFEFQSTDQDRSAVRKALEEFYGSMIDTIIIPDNFSIMYHVRFDKKTRKEMRFFTIEKLKLSRKTLVLREAAALDAYLVKRDNTYVPLTEATLITEKELQANEELHNFSKLLRSIEEKIAILNTEIANIQEAQIISENQLKKEAAIATPVLAKNADGVDEEFIQSMQNPELLEKQHKLSELLDKQENLKLRLGEFDIEEVILQLQDEIEALEESTQGLNLELNNAEAEIAKLQKAENNDAQKKALNDAKKALATSTTKLEKANEEILSKEQILKSLKEPLSLKYTDDPNVLNKHLGSLFENVFRPLLPKVVFWKHSSSYILQDETEFREMNDAKSLDDISRPLVNLFRIGLGTNTLDDLKEKVAEIQNDSSERSRLQTRLNKNMEKYLKNVWPEYDQKINISLEQERIRVQFFDPKCENAGYYNMLERSQGCQTFISFLLTIGAEAKHGVITNTVLLLDEPETHLHPSGVRFMLQELIKTAENGNKVLFATHSNFMIDRENYNRHIIIRKEKEQTIIEPSSRYRIGFFMQEEVLYSTLDINLTKDFDSTNKYNFVFEGEGDATIFEHFYNKVLSKDKDRPFAQKNTSFYHGGKCSDIKNYFTRKPIQLGTKWVFVLDGDEPAKELKSFIESRYKDFIDKYIFVFQYSRDDMQNKTVELEDLLPSTLLSEVVKKSAVELDSGFEPDLLDQVLSSQSFAEYFHVIANHFEEATLFKSMVKRTLNLSLRDKLESIKKSEFEEQFSSYSSWAHGVVNAIKKSMSTN